MEAAKKYIEEHTQLQELISVLLNKSKLFGLNRYSKWGPIKKLVAMLKIICIGDIEKDGILIMGVQTIYKKDLKNYLGSYITKEELKSLKYRICVVHRYTADKYIEVDTKDVTKDVYVTKDGIENMHKQMSTVKNTIDDITKVDTKDTTTNVTKVDKQILNLKDIYLIKNPKIVNEEEISININYKILMVCPWRDVGDGLLLATNYSSELNKLFNSTNIHKEIIIDRKNILTAVRE